MATKSYILKIKATKVCWAINIFSQDLWQKNIFRLNMLFIHKNCGRRLFLDFKHVVCPLCQILHYILYNLVVEDLTRCLSSLSNLVHRVWEHKKLWAKLQTTRIFRIIRSTNSEPASSDGRTRGNNWKTLFAIEANRSSFMTTWILGTRYRLLVIIQVQNVLFLRNYWECFTKLLWWRQ